MTLNNVTMRRTHNSSLQQQQQRWSIPADGKNLLVQKDSNEYNPQKRYTISPDEYYRRSWSSESSDSVISSESGSNCYRVVLIGEHGVGKSSLANIFAGVHDSIDSDCEVLGGKCCVLGCWCLLAISSASSNWHRKTERLFNEKLGNKHLDLIFKTDSNCASLLRKQESKNKMSKIPTVTENLFLEQFGFTHFLIPKYLLEAASVLPVMMLQKVWSSFHAGLTFVSPLAPWG